jgi:CHASE3 domain sensor protein
MKMNIRMKILAGFGVALIFLLVVGVIGATGP